MPPQTTTPEGRGVDPMKARQILTGPLAVTVLAVAACGARADVLVSNGNTNSVLRFDNGGTFLGTFAAADALFGPRGLTFGPDGNLYAASSQSPSDSGTPAAVNSVVRF